MVESGRGETDATIGGARLTDKTRVHFAPRKVISGPGDLPARYLAGM